MGVNVSDKTKAAGEATTNQKLYLRLIKAKAKKVELLLILRKHDSGPIRNDETKFSFSKLNLECFYV